MTPHRTVLAAALGTLLLGGCATYMEARENVKPGGKLDQEKQAAQADLQAAQSEKTRLTSEKELREAELRRNDERIRAVQAETQRQDQVLAAALKSKQLTQQRYDALKKEVDSIRAESQSLDLQIKSAAFRQSDPKADAAKEQKLRELERRKQELSKTLAEMTSAQQ
jgi:PBP1b-binding outer membrane lipoprotein LpoB